MGGELRRVFLWLFCCREQAACHSPLDTTRSYEGEKEEWKEKEEGEQEGQEERIKARVWCLRRLTKAIMRWCTEQGSAPVCHGPLSTFSIPYQEEEEEGMKERVWRGRAGHRVWAGCG